MHFICENNWLDILERLLSFCTSEQLNARDKRNQTPLFLACERGNTPIVKLLLKRDDIDVNCLDNELLTPFHVAFLKDHREVSHLLWKSPKVNFNIPFCVACSRGDAKLVRTLLINNKNIDINFYIPPLIHPLCMACSWDYQEIINLLLSHRAIDVTAQSEGFPSPLYIACEKGHEGAVKALLSHRDIDVNCVWRNETPLSLASKNCKTEIVGWLVEKGADCNRVMGNGATIFQDACLRDQGEIVAHMIEYSDFSKPITSQHNILHYLCGRSCFKVIPLLMPYLSQEDINQQNNRGNTPFHLLFNQMLQKPRNIEHEILLASLLERYPIDVDIENATQQSLVSFAIRLSSLQLVEVTFKKSQNKQIHLNALARYVLFCCYFMRYNDTVQNFVSNVLQNEEMQQFLSFNPYLNNVILTALKRYAYTIDLVEMQIPPLRVCPSHVTRYRRRTEEVIPQNVVLEDIYQLLEKYRENPSISHLYACLRGWIESIKQRPVITGFSPVIEGNREALDKDYDFLFNMVRRVAYLLNRKILSLPEDEIIGQLRILDILQQKVNFCGTAWIEACQDLCRVLSDQPIGLSWEEEILDNLTTLRESLFDEMFDRFIRGQHDARNVHLISTIRMTKRGLGIQSGDYNDPISAYDENTRESLVAFTLDLYHPHAMINHLQEMILRKTRLREAYLQWLLDHIPSSFRPKMISKSYFSPSKPTTKKSYEKS